MFWYGWEKLKEQKDVKRDYNIPVSVVIPARNEETNLLPLLEALSSQDYPQNHMEVIISDDHSTDLTPDITFYYIKRHGNIRYVKLDDSQEGKKHALMNGITASRYSHILTTDADCLPSPTWVRSMVDCFSQTNADMVAGPVLLKGNGSFFARFQRLEFLSLIGSAAGSLSLGKTVMCNSANLGFRKESYMEVQEELKDNIASGDDVFLLMALGRCGDKKLTYLKNRAAVVTTSIIDTFDDFFKQRQRWASKSRHYRNPSSVFTSLLVFLINLYAVCCLIFAPVFTQFLTIAGLIYIGKSIVDFPFLLSVTRFFGQQRLMYFFLPVQFLYLFYISFTVLLAFTGVFDWKGRLVKW